MDLANIDLLDHVVYACGGPPHDLFRRLRAEDPVHWHPRIQVRKEIDFSINITVSLLLCGGIVILADSVAHSILDVRRADATGVSRVLSVSIAMMLIGLFIMMTRKKAITQIVGLLTMENGVFLSGLSITYGMPMIVEVGIFFDILVAVLILGVFIFRINRTFESISIDSLRSLRE